MKQRLTFFEKKKNQYGDSELKEHGLTLDNIVIGAPQAKHDRLMLCLIRGLLIFACTTGCIGGLISAFNLSFYPLIVIPSLLIIALLVSLLYCNKLYFYIGYFLFFLLFMLGGFTLYFYINSGFQAFLNELYKQYSDYFALSTLREGYEYITNRQLTISIAMIYSGAFLSILLNITISGYMSIVETFFITFPILEVALYIDCKPDFIYMLLLLTSYICVGILRRSSQYRIPMIKNSGDQFLHITSKKHVFHSKLSDYKSILSVAGIAMIFAALFLSLSSLLFYKNYSSRDVNNKLKATTDEFVKMFVQNGVSSFFDRYSSTGGLNKGQIGGVSSVRPDYQTDLEVTFVPVDTHPVYLKAYVGGDYMPGNIFTPANTYIPLKPDDSTSSTKHCISDYTHPSGGYAKMMINNIDGGYDYKYAPYDTVLFEDGVNSICAVNAKRADASKLLKRDTIDSVSTYYTVYDPYMVSDTIDYPADYNQDYQDFVYDTFTDIPRDMRRSLKDFSTTAGLSDFISDLKSNNTETRNAAILSCAETLKAYYLNNYQYTMSPGTTPSSENAVLYFLNTQKRGYCAHFAASSTMVLRSMGIPARYVEGYCIPLSSIVDASAIDNNTRTWLTDEVTPKLTDTGVIEVNVTDGQAHAWVEIYLDEYGWIPYEFTPPSSGEEVISNEFSFTNLFIQMMLTEDGTAEFVEGGSPLIYTFNLKQLWGFLKKPFIAALILIITIFLIVTFKDPLLNGIQLRKCIKSGDYDNAVIIRYTAFVTYVKTRRKLASSCFLIRDFAALLNELTDADTTDFANTTYIAMYSPQHINLEEYKKYSSFVKEQRNCIKKLKEK